MFKISVGIFRRANSNKRLYDSHWCRSRQKSISISPLKLEPSTITIHTTREWERIPRPAYAPRFNGRKVWKRYGSRLQGIQDTTVDSKEEQDDSKFDYHEIH